MKLIVAFLKLVRLPNLGMIVLTQVLFYVALINPFYTTDERIYSTFRGIHFLLLVISSVLIAAAGNIINDYFDLNIDEINKPGKRIIDKQIKRRWAIVWHIVFSATGIFIGFYIDFSAKVFWLGFSNLLCVVLLFGYSISLKKKLLAGNVLVSLLTAWVILVCFLCYYRSLHCTGCDSVYWRAYLNRFIRISFLYAGFAFIMSLVREVVKDMEDMTGDARYGCRTMPIAWGIPASKVFVAVWLVVLLGLLGFIQFYVWQMGWYWSIVYCVLLLIIPLIQILRRLFTAQVPQDYHRLSTLIKLVMLAGIISLIFFRIQ